MECNVKRNTLTSSPRRGYDFQLFAKTVKVRLLLNEEEIEIENSYPSKVKTGGHKIISAKTPVLVVAVMILVDIVT